MAWTRGAGSSGAVGGRGRRPVGAGRGLAESSEAPRLEEEEAEYMTLVGDAP